MLSDLPVSFVYAQPTATAITKLRLRDQPGMEAPDEDDAAVWRYGGA